MHYAGRRSTIGGRDGHEQKGKRERERKKERERESIELGYEVEKGGMILMENVRETNENERRGEDRRRRRRRGREGGKREREKDDVP